MCAAAAAFRNSNTCRPLTILEGFVLSWGRSASLLLLSSGLCGRGCANFSAIHQLMKELHLKVSCAAVQVLC